MANVMIVDDDPIYRALLREILKPDNHLILEARDGNDAIWLINHQVFMSPGSGLPDLFILDFQMAGLNGYELVRLLRAREDTRNIPILMLTGTGRDLKTAVEMEGVRFFPKTCASQVLLQNVREMLGESGRKTAEEGGAQSTDKPELGQSPPK